MFKYRKIQPPDELTREIVYRLIRQKIAPLTVVEHNNFVYVVGMQKNKLLAFRIKPPNEEDEKKRIKGWTYRTIRDIKMLPLVVLKEGLNTLKRQMLN